MMVAFSSLLSTLVVERFGQRMGLFCLFALNFAAFLCVVYERSVFSLFFCQNFLLFLSLNSYTSSEGAEIVANFMLNSVC